MAYRAYKTHQAKTELVEDADSGTFEALVSVFGNVDLVGDRVVKGAFTKSLDRWAQTGDPIPIIWSHQWEDPKAHLGEVVEAEERDEGLWIKGKLDVEDAATYAPTVWRKMRRRLVKEFSFAYDVISEKANGDANELLEVDLLEVGPCLKGVNPATQLLAVKEEAAALALLGKSGRVLSAKNEASIREAARLLGDVLSQLERSAGDEGEATKHRVTPAEAGQEPDVRSPFSLYVLAQADLI